ncbi:MAG: hypothetical protein WC451_04065 [Patescibacteria group bacterium]
MEQYNNFYFVLGRENKISQKELENVLASFDFGLNKDSVSILSDHVLEIKLKVPKEKVADLINVLGGTVKIFEKVAPRDSNIASLLVAGNAGRKLLFGISNYSLEKIDTFKMALAAKKQVRQPVRVIDGKEDGKLSSAQSFQYKMDGDNIELGIFKTGIGRLIAVQNIDLWTEHDYGKPKSDARSGMLPPKLARMMVNLAVSQVGNKKGEIRKENSPLKSHLSSLLLVDPFCGSGNILIEALSVGCDIIGSDISEKAVADSGSNVDWFVKFKPSNLKANVFQADALCYDFGQINVDFVIVAEPYLGEPRNSKLRIEEEKEVKKDIKGLYTDFFQNLKLTTKSSNLKAICIVFPLFELANGKQLSIFNECVDFISELGYTTICSPLVYGRDYQVVKREIVLLQLT